jgi:hypothetical protein
MARRYGSRAETVNKDKSVTLVERLFGLWGYVAAWLLWRGHVAAPASL